MPRLRPVHRLSEQEASLASAIADERKGDSERARNARLKEKIEAYWRERGFEVCVNLIDGPFTPTLRENRVDLRSDLINGLPRKESDEQ